MEGSSRNIAGADDLDSTVLRHQVQRYFNELQQEANLSDTPLNMDFLGMKRKTGTASSISMRTSTLDSGLAKKIRFDASGTGENSLIGDISTFSRRAIQDTSSQFAKSNRNELASQLENQLTEKQAKIVELQQKITQMEMKLNASDTSKDQLRLELSSIKDMFKAKTNYYENKIEDLQIEIQQRDLLNSNLARENQLKRESLDHFKLASAEGKLSYSKELSKLEEMLLEMQTNHEAQLKELKQSLEEAIWESKKSRMDAEEAREQLKIRERIPSPCDHQAVIDQQQQVIVEMENALFSQRMAFSQSQEAKLAKIPQLEKEVDQLQKINKLYKETAGNELLLKEQIGSLQESLQRYKNQCQAIPSLEGELKKLRDRLQDWEYLAQRLFDANSQLEVRNQVEEMRRKELKLTNDIGNLQAELNSSNRTIMALKDQIESLKDGNRTKLELEDRVRKLERKLLVVQKDRDHYRMVNEMYEREMTHVGAPALASMEAKQVQELEKLLEEYRNLLSSSGTPKNDELTEERDRLAKQVAEMNSTIESLRKELASSSDTRVLHFSSNPLDNARRQALQQLSQLEKENESLRERMRLIESGHSQNLTLLVGEHFEQGCTPERLKDLEEKLKSAELKNQRVEEVFRKYCSDFRHGIFELFGYQVDQDECGNFKLTSVFSESGADYLSFKYVGAGLMVMDSPYLNTIDDLVQLHITNQKSIPVFLSALTIELFSRQSINSSAYPSVMDTPS